MRSDRMRLTALTLMGLLCLVVGAEKPAPEPVKKPRGTARLGDLHAEVAVLQTINALRPTAEQTEVLLEVAAKTMQTAPPRRKVEVSEDYLKALNAVRAALVSGDEAKIESTHVALDKLREKEDPETDEVEITDAARRVAPGLLKRFSARQVAAYVGGLREFPDPVEDTIAGDGRGPHDRQEGVARPARRHGVPGRLAGRRPRRRRRGEGPRQGRPPCSTGPPASTRPPSRSSARPLRRRPAPSPAGLGPTDVLRHFMERVIAETISNHRFEAAMRMREE